MADLFKDISAPQCATGVSGVPGKSSKEACDTKLAGSIIPPAGIPASIDSLCKAAGGIKSTLDKVTKQGDPSGVAFQVENKAKTIAEGYCSKISKLNFELESLKGNPNLSETERGKKIKEIENKISALEQEGKAKMDALLTITGMIPKLNAMLKNIVDKGGSTDKITAILRNIVDNINPSCSNFSGKGDDKIDEKIKKGVTGSDSDDGLKKQEDSIQAELDKIDIKINSNTTKPKEKESLSTQKDALHMELDFIKELEKTFSK